MKKRGKKVLLLWLLLCSGCHFGNKDDDFIRGVDISSIVSLENSGVTFFDFKGRPCNLYQFLRSQGVTHVRVRVWVDPYDQNGKGYGGGNCDIDTALIIARRAKEVGLKMMIDFHYSDFWADPTRQLAPKSWKDRSVPEKEELLYDYTYQSLQKLQKTGVDITMVQIGNETTNGFVGETDWNQISSLMKAGSHAVRTWDKDIQIALHFTDPQREGYLDYFAHTLEQYEVDYDVFGVSYYSYWHGTLENLYMVLDGISSTYDKDVMVLETAYPYTLKDSDFFANNAGEGLPYVYEISPQGQQDAILDVMDTMLRLSRGIGFCYWEPAWISVGGHSYEENAILWEKWGSGCSNPAAQEYDPENIGAYICGSSWDNQALFDEMGRPLSSLTAFQDKR